MGQYDFDVVVIGAGPGGYIAAVNASKNGFKTACVEKRPTLGGTCLNVGCIPSKALLQSTEHFEWLKQSGKEHGIEANEVSINFPTLMQRKVGVVKGLVDSVAALFKANSIERLQGEAHFVDPHTIEVIEGSNIKKVTAANFIIATGSEPIALPFLPFDEKKVVSSTGALSLESIPKQLLVIGAGVIGVELASVYRRLGSQVTIVEMLESITPAMDQAVSRQLLQILKKQGMEFYLGAKVTGAKVDKEGVQLDVLYEGKAQIFKGDVVLVAVGRRPYTAGLKLEALDIEVDPKGFIKVDDQLRTKHSHIYAIGDVIEGAMLAHKASQEGIVATDLIAGKTTHINYMCIPNVVYTHPEVAAIGFTENEAKEAGREVVVGTSFFRGNARARCNGEVEGFVKVIGDKKTGRLLGMHIIGPQASELIGEGLIGMEKGALVRDIAMACHAHPTLSETIMEACQHCGK